MSEHTPGPWRYREWGGLIVGGGTGSDEVLICTMATNTRHDEGRHNHALILAAPTMQARIAELETEVERLRAEIHEIASVLPGVAYMDPPDGGSPSLPEQFRRMRADLDRTAAERDALRADAERYRWLRGDQCDIVVGTNPGAMDYGMSGVFGTYDDWLGGDELDAAIDAARGES